MEGEMNQQNEEGFGNSPDNDSDTDINYDPCLDPGIGPDSDPGFMSDFEHVPRSAELREDLSGILSLASELESVIYLSGPRDNYASHRRAQLRSRLSSELDKLQRYRLKLDREVLRCESNLDRIHADSERIHLEQTREHYDQAETLQQEQYREAVSDRDAVSWAITKVQAALRSAQFGGFGGGGPLAPSPPISPLPGYQNNPGGLGNEVDELLSLGPLRYGQR